MRGEILRLKCMLRATIWSQEKKNCKTGRVFLQEFIQKLTQSLQQYTKHHGGHLEQAIFRKKIVPLNGKSLYILHFKSLHFSFLPVTYCSLRSKIYILLLQATARISVSVVKHTHKFVAIQLSTAGLSNGCAARL